MRDFSNTFSNMSAENYSYMWFKSNATGMLFTHTDEKKRVYYITFKITQWCWTVSSTLNCGSAQQSLLFHSRWVFIVFSLLLYIALQPATPFVDGAVNEPLREFASCPVSTIPLPFFCCRFAVAVSRCRFRTPLPLPLPLCSVATEFDGNQFPWSVLHHWEKLTINEYIISMPWLVSVDDWLASYRTTEK